MKNCTTCGYQFDDDAAFCPNCGSQQPVPGAQPVYQQPYPNQQPYAQPAYQTNDHTLDFDAEDVAENKLFAICVYLFGFIGIAIALLKRSDSPYLAFHIRQGMKLAIVEGLTAIITVALCWTFIVPAAGGIFTIVMFVVEIICIVNTCQGKSKDVPIIGSWNFLK